MCWPCAGRVPAVCWPWRAPSCRSAAPPAVRRACTRALWLGSRCSLRAASPAVAGSASAPCPPLRLPLFLSRSSFVSSPAPFVPPAPLLPCLGSLALLACCFDFHSLSRCVPAWRRPREARRPSGRAPLLRHRRRLCGLRRCGAEGRVRRTGVCSLSSATPTRLSHRYRSHGDCGGVLACTCARGRQPDGYRVARVGMVLADGFHVATVTGWCWRARAPAVVDRAACVCVWW